MSDDVHKKTIFNLRVLDEDAMREQADKLTSLIDDAASSSRELDGLIESGRKVSTGAASAKQELQDRLQLGGRVLKAMESELNRVEQVLGGLGERQEQAEEASTKLHGRLSEIDGRIDTAMSAVDKRVTVALDDLDAHRQSTERTRTRLEHLLEATSALGDRFREIQAQLASGMGKFEEGLERALEGIEAGKGQAERVSSQLDDQIFALKARVNDFAGCFDQQLKPALAEIETWRQDSNRTSEQLRQQLDELQGRFGPCIEQCRDMSQQTLEQLRPAVERLKSIEEHAGEAQSTLLRRFAELQEHVQTTLSRVEDQITPTLHELAGHQKGSEAAAADLRERCRAIQEQVTAATIRLEDRIGALQQSPQDGEETRSYLERRFADLQSGFDTAAERIGSRMSETLNEALAQRVKIADNQEKLGTAVGEMGDKLSAALSKLDDRLQGAMPGIADFEKHFQDLHHQLAAVTGRLAEQIERLPEALPDQDSGAAEGRLERRFTDLQLQLNTSADRTHERMTEAVSGLQALEQRLEESSAATRTQIDDIQGQLRTTVQQIEERMLATLADSSGQTQAGGASSVQVEHHFEDLRDQLTALNGRIEKLDTGGLNGKVEEQLTDFQGQFAALAERLENRMAEAIGELEVRTHRIELDASKDPSQVVDLQKQLSTLVGRMGDRVIAAVKGGGGGPGGDRKIDEQFADLRSKLATVAGRLESQLKEALGEIATSTRRSAAAGTPAPTIDVQAQMSGLLDRMERKIVAAIGQRGSGSGDLDARLEQRFTDLRQQFDAAFARLEGRLDPALAAMHKQPEPTGDPSKEYLQDVGDLQAQLTEVRALLEARRPEPEVKAAVRPTPTLPDTPSGRLVKECIESINSGDADILRTFVSRCYADSALKSRNADDRVVVYLRIYEESGGIQLRRVEKCGVRKVVVFVEQKATNGWYRCQFELDPTPPHKIVNVYIDPVEPLDDDHPSA